MFNFISNSDSLKSNVEKCANTERQLAMQMKKNVTILPELTVTFLNKFQLLRDIL